MKQDDKANAIVNKVQDFETTYEDELAKCTRFYNVYRNLFDVEDGGDYSPRAGNLLTNWQSRANPNLVLADIEDKIAIMMEGAAPIEITTSNPEHFERVEVVMDALNEIKNETFFDDITEDCARMARIFGTSFRKLGIANGNLRSGERPLVLFDEAISLFDIAFEPGVRKLSESSWINHKFYIPISQAKRLWRNAEFRPGVSNQLTSGVWEDERKKSTFKDLVEIYEFYELDEEYEIRQEKYKALIGNTDSYVEGTEAAQYYKNPNGKIYWVHNGQILEVKKNPYSIYPNIIDFRNIRLPDQLFGLSDIEILEKMYIEILDITRRLLDKTTLDCNPPLLMTADTAMSNRTLGISPGELYELSNPESIVRYLEGIPMTNNLIAAHGLILNLFERMSGSYQVAPVQAAQMPGVALQIYNNIQQRRERQKKRNLIRHLREWTKQVLPMLDVIYENEFVPNSTSTIERPYQPIGEIDYRLKLGEVPMSVAEDRQWALTLANVLVGGKPVIDREWFWKHSHIDGWELIKLREQEEQAQLMAQMQQQADLTGGLQDAGGENQQAMPMQQGAIQ